jgi:hypothetical protein
MYWRLRLVGRHVHDFGPALAGFFFASSLTWSELQKPAGRVTQESPFPDVVDITTTCRRVDPVLCNSAGSTRDRETALANAQPS